jgi:hypothetical protein
MFLRSKVRRVRRVDNLTASMSRLSRQCGILNISQPYRPPRPVLGIALLYFFLPYISLLYFYIFTLTFYISLLHFANIFLNDLCGGSVCNHYYIKNSHTLIEVVIRRSSHDITLLRLCEVGLLGVHCL